MSEERNNQEAAVEWVCPSCDPEDDWVCGHSAEMEPLAAALAGAFQETDEPNRQQIGWFMDDADSLLADVGEPPYEVVMWDPANRLTTFAFTVNGILCTVPEGEGQVDAVAIAKPRVEVLP